MHKYSMKACDMWIVLIYGHVVLEHFQMHVQAHVHTQIFKQTPTLLSVSTTSSLLWPFILLISAF